MVQYRDEQAERLETQFIQTLHLGSRLCVLRKGVVGMLPFIAQDGHWIMRAINPFVDAQVMYAGQFY